MEASSQTRHSECRIYREKLNFPRCINSNRKERISQECSPSSWEISEKVKAEGGKGKFFTADMGKK